jgi:DNA-binding transcriptional LysR family regulator
LRYFVAVADAGTFTHAAERMFVAQPTLSQQIRRLEELVGTPLLQRRREGVRLTTAGTVLLEESRAVLSLIDHGVSRTRQAAGVGRPKLRFVVPPYLPEALAVAAASRLRATAAAAGVDVAWMETALDAEFSAIGRRHADAGLGWLPPAADALPAGLDVMSVGEFEPEVWIPATYRAAADTAIGLAELAQLDIVHGPRRQPGDLRRLAGAAAGHRPPVRVHRPAVPQFAADDPRLRGHGHPAHRGAHRPAAPARTGARPGTARPSGRQHLRHGSPAHRPPSADRHRRAGLERRPAPPAPAGALRRRRHHRPLTQR